MICSPTRKFQFPPNGKGHFKEGSIENPIKFPSFQFPPNGKGHFKGLLGSASGVTELVSIPSKRESAFQDSMNWRSFRVSTGRFNSLQTGKGISRVMRQAITDRIWQLFQFPPNGKVHFKPREIRTGFHSRTKRFNSLQTGKRISRIMTSPNGKK